MERYHPIALLETSLYLHLALPYTVLAVDSCSPKHTVNTIRTSWRMSGIDHAEVNSYCELGCKLEGAGRALSSEALHSEAYWKARAKQNQLVCGNIWTHDEVQGIQIDTTRVPWHLTLRFIKPLR